jgi:microcompartment protein CcmK/EutM
MNFGIVAGSVVSDTKADTLPAAKYLLVQFCDQTGKVKDDFLVAIDDIGAGSGEMVLVTQGTSARQTETTDKKPIDAAIIGIVDLVDEHGKIAYKK